MGEPSIEYITHCACTTVGERRTTRLCHFPVHLAGAALSLPPRERLAARVQRLGNLATRDAAADLPHTRANFA